MRVQSLPAKILQAVEAAPEGTLVSAREMLHLGKRAAVDQALSRLVKAGRLVRISRGTFLLPVAGRFGPRVPSAFELVGSMAGLRGEMVAPHGAVAANELGLTTQVPIRPIFLTSGRSRRLQVGGQSVEFRHAPGWQLLMPERPAGAALRALAWLGPMQAHEAVPELAHRLSKQEVEAMVGARSKLPTWVAQELSPLAAA
jgi:hypothetical protein